MNIEYLKKQGTGLAVVTSETVLIADAQSAMDLAMSVYYETSVSRLVLDKRIFCEDFFILSTGIAGEVLQKFINYHIKAAIFGDYSQYTSKPLKDFIYESNNGKDFFFVATKEEAIEKLTSIA